MRLSSKSLLFLAVLSLALPATLSACSCVVTNAKTCALVGYYDIFVGHVTSIEHPPGTLKVHLAVQRVFKGSAESEAIAYTADNDGACGYPFKDGETYVVYTGRDSVSLCGDTKPLALAKSSEMRFLAHLKNGPFTGSNFGRLTRASDSQIHPPLPGIAVFVNDGKKDHFAGTDGKGKFQISGVPEGIYEVQARLPSSLTLPIKETSERIHVDPHECVFVELSAANNGSISGKVSVAPGQNAAEIMVWAMGPNFHTTETTLFFHRPRARGIFCRR